MDPSAFRQFLKDCPDLVNHVDLINAAVHGGSARMFINFCLQLRDDSRGRKEWYQFMQENRERVAGRKPSRWFLPFCYEAFNMYLLFHLRWKPRSVRANQDALSSCNRETLRKLARTGQCKYKQVPLVDVVRGKAGQVVDALTNTQCILWVDNFYRRRFAPSPHNSNLSLNSTVFTCLTLPFNVGPFNGYPSLSTLSASVQIVAAAIADGQRAHRAHLSTLERKNLQLKDIRAPLDVKRDRVRSLLWRPAHLSELVVGKNEQLVSILRECLTFQGLGGRPLPLLVDMNIHYRVCKLMYSETYSAFSAHPINHIPLIYGIWHPYKYCVTVCFRKFFSLCVRLTAGHVAAGVPVVPYQKLIYMERLFAVLFAIGPKWRNILVAKIKAMEHPVGTFGPRPWQEKWKYDCHGQAKALHSLLFEYIPAIFSLGMMVRQCNWGGEHRSAHLGGTILNNALHILYSFFQGREQSVEYIRTIIVARLLWVQWSTFLAPRCLSEEMCEALLARTVAFFRKHPNLTTFDAQHDLFLMTPLAKQHQKDLHDSKIAKDLVKWRKICPILLAPSCDVVTVFLPGHQLKP